MHYIYITARAKEIVMFRAIAEHWQTAYPQKQQARRHASERERLILEAAYDLEQALRWEADQVQINA